MAMRPIVQEFKYVAVLQAIESNALDQLGNALNLTRGVTRQVAQAIHNTRHRQCDQARVRHSRHAP